MFIPVICVLIALSYVFGDENVPSPDQNGPNTIRLHHCPAGYYKSGTGLCTQCSPGTYGYGGERGPSSCHSCGVNTYNPAYGGSSHFYCKPCPNGMTSLSGASACTPKPAQCERGTYGIPPPSGSCTACAKGKYNDLVGQKSSHACKSCPAGKTTPGTRSQSLASCSQVLCNPGTYGPVNGVCRVCEKGKYSERESSTTCTSCPTGKTTRRPQSSRRTDCLTECRPGTYGELGAACRVCQKGKYSERESSTTCTSCPTGKTTVREGRTGLSDCVNECAAGEYGVHACNKCPIGRYFSGRGALRVEECKHCPSGKSTRADGATSETECDSCPRGKFGTSPNCITCPEGKYASELGQRECVSCTYGLRPNKLKTGCERLKCEPGQVESPDGSCSDCPEGYHLPTWSDSSHCLPCGAGYFSGKKASSCSRCVAGRFSAVEGQGRCEVCPGGTHSLVGAKLCERCSAGFYSPSGARECLKCPRQTYSSEEGSDECFYCENQMHEGSTHCPGGGGGGGEGFPTLAPHEGYWPDWPNRNHSGGGGGEPDWPGENDDDGRNHEHRRPGGGGGGGADDDSSANSHPTPTPTLLPGSGGGNPSTRSTTEGGGDGEAGVIAAAVLVPTLFCCGLGAFIFFFFFMRRRGKKNGEETLTPYEAWMKAREAGQIAAPNTGVPPQPEVESTHNPIVGGSAPPLTTDHIPALEEGRAKEGAQVDDLNVDIGTHYPRGSVIEEVANPMSGAQLSESDLRL